MEKLKNRTKSYKIVRSKNKKKTHSILARAVGREYIRGVMASTPQSDADSAGAGATEPGESSARCLPKAAELVHWGRRWGCWKGQYAERAQPWTQSGGATNSTADASEHGAPRPEPCTQSGDAANSTADASESGAPVPASLHRDARAILQNPGNVGRDVGGMLDWTKYVDNHYHAALVSPTRRYHYETRGWERGANPPRNATTVGCCASSYAARQPFVPASQS